MKKMGLMIFFLFFLSPLFGQSEKPDYIHRDPKGLMGGCACHLYNPGDPSIITANQAKKCGFCHGSEEKGKKAKERKFIYPEVSLLNIDAEFAKSSHHPVEKSGAEKIREIGRRGLTREELLEKVRLVQCTDCHNPHFTRKKIKAEKGKRKAGAYPRARGVFIEEYELCYKCHGYSSTLPAGRTNKAIEFQPTNPSYHPVEAEGKSINLPSLLPPLKAGESIINCTDCHNNDNQKGPSGPHGSIYSPILIKNYITADDYPENEFTYALCYECHSRKSILNNESFPFHSLHIVEKKNSCYSCHNSHGSPTNPHLIEFRLDRSEPDKFGRYEFIDRGEFSGECYLKCHPAEKGGVEHSPKSY